ncbi:MAG: polyhydroxyalkanoate synthesis repressor PhaR [uncultured Sphingomonadaceae bacterium]|uniref:Polyhydroxyalkanoate synthesis repressor PhaR n=1 Tax=uncultured Sphingomonadaceae bacterium TaxID=169976 RepID=A0A6J4SPV6_9SPHN|nr:MAG: polyhydroxyalkanoate synthesis repressor PhaR [uncultured Sphingomonadaceae bacterium]
MAKAKTGGDVVTIKKYANRRLYDTESSSYVTLEHLSAMTREGREFRVVDAKTGEDITRGILTQIIMDEESRGATMLPVNFLRQLIALYGDSMQAMVPQYLEASLETFRRNQAQLRDAMTGAFAAGPFAEIAKRNAELFSAAAGAFAPKPAARGGEGQTGEGRDRELAEIKAQIAALQAKLDKIEG